MFQQIIFIESQHFQKYFRQVYEFHLGYYDIQILHE